MAKLTAEEAQRTPEQWLELIDTGQVKFSDIGGFHDTAIRDQVINVLLLQNQTYPQIRKRLGCSDPTISTAKTRLKMSRPLEVVQANTDKYVKEFTEKAEIAEQKLLEIAEDDDSDPGHKIKAVNSAYDIAKQTIEKLEDWGFIRRQPKVTEQHNTLTLEISEEEKTKNQLENQRLDAIEAEVISIENDSNNGTIDPN